MSVTLQRSSLFALALFLLSTAVILGTVSAGTTKEGLIFLEENKKKPDVISMDPVLHISPYGTQYKILKKGAGLEHPKINAEVKVFYEGRKIDGTIFETSYKEGEPAILYANGFLIGWTRALQMMVVGDKWELYIPSEEGFGDRGKRPEGILKGEVLIFTLELVEIVGEGTTAMKCSITNVSDCNEEERAFIIKVMTWVSEGDDWKIKSEAERLHVIIRHEKISGDDLEWSRRELHILKQFRSMHEAGSEAAAAEDADNKWEMERAEEL